MFHPRQTTANQGAVQPSDLLLQIRSQCKFQIPPILLSSSSNFPSSQERSTFSRCWYLIAEDCVSPKLCWLFLQSSSLAALIYLNKCALSLAVWESAVAAKAEHKGAEAVGLRTILLQPAKPLRRAFLKKVHFLASSTVVALLPENGSTIQVELAMWSFVSKPNARCGS
eukprot:3466293-Rhodomonas_salina.1